MKPNFAISLSFEGIKLLHRAAGGWREVGEVPVTAADLAGELAMLRRTAASLEPGGVRSKLLIPESQIKYLTLDTAGLSDAARRTAAETALQGATPYQVSELAYDISADGAKTHVAAVARETLAEAEAFASEHRFHPVSFVAVPGDAPYLGEPYFGMTAGAADLLEPGEEVEPDGIAVVIVGSVPAAADPEAAIAPDESPMLEQAPIAPEEAAAPPLNAEVEPPVAAAPSLTTSNTPSVPEDPSAAEPVAAERTSEPSGAPEPLGDDLAAADPKRKAPDAPDPSPAPAPQSARDLSPTPASRSSAGGEAPEEKTSEPVSTRSLPPAPEAPSDAPALARPTKPAAAASLGAPRKPTLSATQKAPVSAPRGDAAPTGFASRRLGPAGRGPAGSVPQIASAPPKSGSTPPAPDSSSLTQPAPVLADSPAQSPARGGFLSRRKPRTGTAAPVPAPAAAVQATGTEAERMTVFGARAGEVGGKPRFLGLIMTVILLVFLAGVAAWAAVFLDDGLAGLLKDDKTRATASAPENQIDPEVIRTPEGLGPERQADGADVQIAALDPVLSAEDTAVLDALQDPQPEPQRAVISEHEAAARYAVNGIWPLSPISTLSLPDTPTAPVYHNGIDPVSAASDAIALPSATGYQTDAIMAAVVSPPPFGQRTQLGAGGLIIPTPDGVVAPGGFTLVAASPPLKPPATVLGPAPATTEEATEDEAAAAQLAIFRPQNRPLGLAERTERAQLGGVTRIELAVYRPALRPPSVQERANEAAQQDAREQESQEDRAAAAAATAAAAALIVPQASVDTPAPAPEETGTRLATAQSIRPDPRPRNFERIVRRAEQAAPTETRVAAAAATVVPRTVTPNIPSRASVARSATVKNAINLRRVNLIGVYGKPSSRRALVRLANGRYQKVTVGDRIDGGRVAAIGNSELRYTKGGRNVVLKMP